MKYHNPIIKLKDDSLVFCYYPDPEPKIEDFSPYAKKSMKTHHVIAHQIWKSKYQEVPFRPEDKAEAMGACIDASDYVDDHGDYNYYTYLIGAGIPADPIVDRVEIVNIYTWNPGNYMNTCAVCKSNFMGGVKLQRVCQECCESTKIAILIPQEEKESDLWLIAHTEFYENTGSKDSVEFLRFLRQNFTITRNK